MITIDSQKCIRCGACVASCPECFDFDDDNGVKAIDTACDCGCSEEAAQNCPGQAISVK